MLTEELYKIFNEHSSVCTDSRKVVEGDLYFALKGENFNGNLFAAEALQKGASYAFIDEKEFQISDKCILVENVLNSLQDLALYHRLQFSIPFIGITGSNGKTTTKELLATVLSSVYKTYATQGNLNNHIGVPLTLLKIKKDAEIAIIEMGANHQKEIEAYCKVALPTHGLINNCGKAHLEGFGGIEGVKKGKAELYDFIRQTNGIIFRNTDLDYLKEMSFGIQKQITYGTYQADYTGIKIMTDMFAGAAITTSRNECVIKTQLVGEYNFANIMAAFAVGRTFGIPVDKIKTAIENYRPDNSRSQLLHEGTNTIILDAYNANPTSMSAAISNFALADYDGKVVMIGGMKELGKESIKEHQIIISLLEQTNWKEVVLVGGDFKYVQHPYLYVENSMDAREWYLNSRFQNTAILIKGSRAFEMEKIIQKQSHT